MIEWRCPVEQQQQQQQKQQTRVVEYLFLHCMSSRRTVRDHCNKEIASSARGQTSQPGKGRRETSLYIMTVSTALTYYFLLEWRYHTVPW